MGNSKKFDVDIFYGHLVRGNLTEGMSYLCNFKEENSRVERYKLLFEKQKFIHYSIADELNNILFCYQIYYRKVFYLGILQETAEKELLNSLVSYLDLDRTINDLASIEECVIAPLFRKHGLIFMGGRTGGYYGPYVWKNTEKRTYFVDLPDGIQPYTVYLHSDFICKSWLDYISFGEISTGGWADKNGEIHCIADCYDEDSEAFQVSLLKHEAQHTKDLSLFPDMSQELLEYRAKLVELIYSQERNLLITFFAQCGDEHGHSLAASRIMEEFAGISDISNIQTRARELFDKSIIHIKF